MVFYSYARGEPGGETIASMILGGAQVTTFRGRWGGGWAFFRGCFKTDGETGGTARRAVIPTLLWFAAVPPYGLTRRSPD